MCDFLKNHNFWKKLIPKIDSVAHSLSKSIYFNATVKNKKKLQRLINFRNSWLTSLLKIFVFCVFVCCSYQDRDAGYRESTSYSSDIGGRSNYKDDRRDYKDDRRGYSSSSRQDNWSPRGQDQRSSSSMDYSHGAEHRSPDRGFRSPGNKHGSRNDNQGRGQSRQNRRQKQQKQNQERNQNQQAVQAVQMQAQLQTQVQLQETLQRLKQLEADQQKKV